MSRSKMKAIMRPLGKDFWAWIKKWNAEYASVRNGLVQQQPQGALQRVQVHYS